MSDTPDTHGLARQLAVLEERMDTKQTEYESALERLRADLARRDTANTRWLVGTIAAATAIIIGAMALLLAGSG